MGSSRVYSRSPNSGFKRYLGRFCSFLYRKRLKVRRSHQSRIPLRRTLPGGILKYPAQNEIVCPTTAGPEKTTIHNAQLFHTKQVAVFYEENIVRSLYKRLAAECRKIIKRRQGQTPPPIRTKPPFLTYSGLSKEQSRNKFPIVARKSPAFSKCRALNTVGKFGTDSKAARRTLASRNARSSFPRSCRAGSLLTAGVSW